MPPPFPQLCPQAPASTNHDALPWREVAKGDKLRGTRPLPPTPVDDDSYLDLRISKLRHRNTTFPHRTDIYALATIIYIFLAPFRLSYNSLREAQEMAVGGRRLLHDDFAEDIVFMRPDEEGIPCPSCGGVD